MNIGKIRLSKEEAVAIEKFLKHGDNDIATMIDGHEQGMWLDKYTPLNGLATSDLARALLIGYEVEEEFKVGDWVAKKDGKRFANGLLIAKVEKVRKDYVTHSSNMGASLEALRHATPEEIKAEKERQLWKSIGREVGEFRVGDVVLLGLCEVKFITNTQDAKKAYERGKVLGFYPIDSLVGFGGGSE